MVPKNFTLILSLLLQLESHNPWIYNYGLSKKDFANYKDTGNGV